MKIAYFINTFNSINWGGQATSNAIKYMLSQAYPKAEFIPMNMPVLPFKKMKVLRAVYEKKLVEAIMEDDMENVLFYLKKMNIPSTIFSDFTHICFNGEGAVHAKSGHIRLFMGLLYIAKKQKKIVAAVNQTIDLAGDKTLEAVLSKVYNMLDFVSVREPISLSYAKSIGIKKVELIPDAVYGLPVLSNDEIDKIVQAYKLPDEYIAVTGSSILKRDKKSLRAMRKVLTYITQCYSQDILFMANAKTDIWLAHKLKEEFHFRIIEPPVKYIDAMGIIARAKLVVGGRQHPNIFSYIYQVPYIPFKGNTFKNDGVVELQKYPLKPLSWEVSRREFEKAVETIKNYHAFRAIGIENFDIFDTAAEDMKKVAIVVTNLASSGAEKIALSQAKLFKEHGHEVVLFLVDNVKEYDTEECEFPIETLTSGKNTYKVLGKVGDRIYAEILQKKMQKYGGFDIVISNLPRADRVVKLIDHPNKYFVIHTSYKTELEKFANRRGQKKSKLYQYLYANEKIITVANAIIDDFDNLKIPYKQALTIYNPFSFEYIRKKGEENTDLDFEYIISPTAFRKEKRYDIMLDAFKMLKHDIKLVILANRDSRLEAMIKERGLEERVVILGFQQNPYKYIKQAKLLVLSSEREGLPTVVIESLILGTPVVATNCPTGPSEILTGGLEKWLVPMEDPKALAEKIDEALESEIEIDESVLDKFNKETIYQQFKALL
jgi:glycosyltransferase involved in cell wall biosynthesis/polysaccharide pyruvyl transferase WcaK-like protein